MGHSDTEQSRGSQASTGTSAFLFANKKLNLPIFRKKKGFCQVHVAGSAMGMNCSEAESVLLFICFFLIIAFSPAEGDGGRLLRDTGLHRPPVLPHTSLPGHQPHHSTFHRIAELFG